MAGALQRRVESLQMVAQRNGALAGNAIEAGGCGVIGYGLGRAEQMGIENPEMVGLGIGIASSFLAPNGMVKRAGMALVKTTLAIKGYKLGKGV